MLIRYVSVLLLFYSVGAYPEFDRHIKLDGEDNMRDMGGFVTTDGRRVAKGKLFRSGQLDELTDSDVRKLADLGIEQVVDLRSGGELEAHPSRLPDGVPAHHLSLSWNTGPEQQRKSLDAVMRGEISGRELLSSAYTEIGEGKIQSWTEFFDVLETGDTTLWHCAGGRDRAGITAALTLLALGVDKQTALEDHVASNQYLHKMNEAMRAQVRAEYGAEAVANIDEVLILDPWMMQSFYDAVDQAFGSMDAFFEVLDVDRAALRRHYLEPN